MNKQQLWQAILGELELILSKAHFTTWFKNTFITEASDDEIIIAVPNAFTKVWLENKYHQHILKAAQNISTTVKKISYQIESLSDKKPLFNNKAIKNSNETPVNEPQKTNKFGLNEKYNFQTFIIGKGNELACAAAKSVAKNPGKNYNPLFIYGGVGLGKTHLMQSIGNYLIFNSANKKILYINSEKFTNDFVRAIKNSQIDNFKKLYRQADLLLVDDIQFMAGKEQTQEEFFHTFNELYQNEKQIVLSSDRPPKAIPALEQRLISRFEWGMIADIGSPDLETRMAILQSKCQEKNTKFDHTIINYIATNIQSNVRELEGALNKIIAYWQLNNTEPTLDVVKNLLSSLVKAPIKSGLTPKQIINTVANYFDVTINDITGNCRKRGLVIPRQIIMYLMREELKSSYPSIGQELGGRDHTTAIHAITKISGEINEESKIKNDIILIRQRLYNNGG
jgi:chromosomal replication initiator protein